MSSVDPKPAVSTVLPVSYSLAKAHNFTTAEVDTLIAKYGSPIFLDGHLMIPSVLSDVTGIEGLAKVAAMMTPAKVSGFKRYQVLDKDFPTLVKVKGAEDNIVEGLVVLGLDMMQRNLLHVYQNGPFIQIHAPMTIEVEGGATLELDGGVYVWAGRNREIDEKGGEKWSLETYVKSSFHSVYVDKYCKEERELERQLAESSKDNTTTVTDPVPVPAPTI